MSTLRVALTGSKLPQKTFKINGEYLTILIRIQNKIIRIYIYVAYNLCLVGNRIDPKNS